MGSAGYLARTSWAIRMAAKSKPLRQLRYGVAMSLDGYIAGPCGEADWIVMDPEIDFAAIWQRFDTLDGAQDV